MILIIIPADVLIPLIIIPTLAFSPTARAYLALGTKPDKKEKPSAILIVQTWERVATQKITQSFSPNPEIFFSPLGEEKGIECPIIIDAEIGGHCIHHMYLDGGSASEILYEHCFNRLRLEIKNQLAPAITSLIRFIGKVILPIRKIQLLVTIGDKEHSALAWMNFMVVRSPSLYNGIIRRPGVRKSQAVSSTAHGMLKIPVEGGIITLKSSMLVPLECTMVFGPEGSLSVTKSMVEERIKLAINPEHPEQTVMIGSTLIGEGRNRLCNLLYRNLDILEEVEKLMEAKIIKEVHYQDWLSNPVMVKKHDYSWRMCVDFKDLNKAYPKDGYSLPEIDWKLARLRRFLAESVEKSLQFFKTMKKCMKKSDFHWTAKAKEAFKQMKQLIAKLSMLVAPMEKEELVVYLAAAKETISAVLITERKTKQMPIYLVSRALRSLEINYTSMEKLVLALVHAKVVAGRLQKWIIELGEYVIYYRPRVSVKGQILAYFIVERPEEDSPDTLMTEEGELLEPWILFDATNNEAKYEALIPGLKIAKQISVKRLKTNVDLRLVANQVNGTYVTKETDITRYLEKVKALTSNFKAFSIKQVPRSENKKEEHVAERLGVNESQPYADQLMVLIHHSPDKIVVSASALSLALDVSDAQVWRIRENITSRRPFLHGVFVPLAEPFTTVALTGTKGTSDTTVGTITALSTTFVSASSIHPISADDYEVMRLDGQEGAGAESQAIADGNVDPFANVDDVDLNVLYSTFIVLSVGMPIYVGMTASVLYVNENGVYPLLDFIIGRLGEGIKARLDARRKNWREKLPHVLWAHRPMIKSSYGYTPFSLTYKTEAVISTEIGMPTLRTMKVELVQNNEALDINLDLLDVRIEEAAIREAKSKTKMEKYYNLKL
nr:hypothetical protein [Tanacetum cinerariifolium]